MKCNMKIYEIGTGYTPIPAKIGAATEIVVEELTRAFLKQGKQVQIIDIAAEDRAETDLPILEVPVPGCFRGTDIKLGLMHKLKRVVYSVCLAGTLKKILKKEQERVVLHFHNQYNLFFFLKLTPRKLRSKALIAYTNHSGIWRQAWPEIENTIRKRYFQEAECMRKADVVFVLNSETKKNAVDHVGADENRIVLIDNGVNTEIYHPLPEAQKLAAKKKWDLEDRRVILQVGSVNENKGQLRTAEYLLPLLRKYPDLVFAYAGGIVDAEYQNRITAFAESHALTRQIRYLGMITPGKELNELYNTAVATILPSRFEAFGLVAVESMAAGVPVFVDKLGMIYFDYGVIPYENNEFCGTAEKVLFADPSAQENHHFQARDFAVRQYAWDNIAGDYMTAFRNGMN